MQAHSVFALPFKSARIWGFCKVFSQPSHVEACLYAPGPGHKGATIREFGDRAGGIGQRVHGVSGVGHYILSMGRLLLSA